MYKKTKKYVIISFTGLTLSLTLNFIGYISESRAERYTANLLDAKTSDRLVAFVNRFNPFMLGTPATVLA